MGRSTAAFGSTDLGTDLGLNFEGPRRDQVAIGVIDGCFRVASILF